MGRKAGMTAAERTAYLEGEFDQVVAQYEAGKAEMTLDQRIASAGRLARLSSGISQSDAAGQRATKAAIEADRAFLKIEAELERALRPNPPPTATVEGDEMDMDDEPNSGRDRRTPDELRREIKGRLDTTKRVGGGVQNFDAIKLLKFSAS